MSLPFYFVTSQNQRPVVFGSPYSSYNAVHSYGEPSPNVGANNRRLAPANKCKKKENGSASPISCNGCLDFLHEQNRGPRASRPKKQATEENSSLENKNEEAYLGLSRELFITEYKVAMFFVIKSFSEDNIHKSIKYGVWASTPSGNKKLDSAYRGAKEREDPCPVFLFFSVNFKSLYFFLFIFDMWWVNGHLPARYGTVRVVLICAVHNNNTCVLTQNDYYPN